MLVLHAQGCSILCTHIQTMSIEAQAAQDAHPLSSRKSSVEYCFTSLHGAILWHFSGLFPFPSIAFCHQFTWFPSIPVSSTPESSAPSYLKLYIIATASRFLLRFCLVPLASLYRFGRMSVHLLLCPATASREWSMASSVLSPKHLYS